MKHYFLYFLLCGFIQLPHFLVGQGLDGAVTFRYRGSLMITDLEPAENGEWNTSGWSQYYGMELRSGRRIGWLLGMAGETITSYKAPASSGGTAEAFNMVHPYHSSLSASYLMLGTQYNLRIGGGDLSFSVLAGPGRASYSRTWNVLNARVFNEKIDFDDLSFSSDVDMSRGTWRLATTASLQYTYWLAEEFAFSVGAEYNQSNYLGGGVATNNGQRYEFFEREFLPGEAINRITPLLYNVNYDVSTLVPDPGTVIRQLRFTIGVTGKFNNI